MHAHTSTHLTRRTVESSLQFNHRPVQQPPRDEPGSCSLLWFPGHVSSTLLASMGNNQTAGTHSGDLPRTATWALQGRHGAKAVVRLGVQVRLQPQLDEDFLRCPGSPPPSWLPCPSFIHGSPGWASSSAVHRAVHWHEHPLGLKDPLAHLPHI